MTFNEYRALVVPGGAIHQDCLAYPHDPFGYPGPLFGMYVDEIALTRPDCDWSERHAISWGIQRGLLPEIPKAKIALGRLRALGGDIQEVHRKFQRLNPDNWAADAVLWPWVTETLDDALKAEREAIKGVLWSEGFSGSRDFFAIGMVSHYLWREDWTQAAKEDYASLFVAEYKELIGVAAQGASKALINKFISSISLCKGEPMRDVIAGEWRMRL